MRTLSSRRSGFTLTELVVVIAIIILLLALIIPVGRKVREQAQLLTCANNMKQLAAGGMHGYANNNDGYLPLAGNIDRNWANDWMWGGQSKALIDARSYSNSGFGFLPECGAVFTEVTGLPRVVPTGSADSAVDKSREYKSFRCPSTGEIGKYMRNNYSMNDAYDFIEDLNNNPDIKNYTSWSSARARAQTSNRGVRLSKIRNPAHKVLLVNESPNTMQNASFAPGGTAARTDIGDENHVSHDGRTNVAMADGHVDQFIGTRPKWNPSLEPFMLRIQRSNRLDLDDGPTGPVPVQDGGAINNLTYWWGPVD